MYIAKNISSFLVANCNTGTRQAGGVNFRVANWWKVRSRHQFAYAGPTKINRLPENIKEKIACAKISLVKKELKEYLKYM